MLLPLIEKSKYSNMKKFILYISFTLILACMASCKQQNNSKNENQGNDESTEIINSQTTQNIDANKLYDKLMASFGDDWIERESDPLLYPEYYGGSFIDNDGNFVIAVTGSIDRNREALAGILGTDNFKIESVSYSYREMMKVMDEIDNFLVSSDISEDHPVLTKFAGAYPDVTENRVIVLLTDVNNEVINSFRRDVINSPLIVFEKGEIPELY